MSAKIGDHKTCASWLTYHLQAKTIKGWTTKIEAMQETMNGGGDQV